MFGSILTYVTLRLLGEGANDGEGAMERGRNWILEHGGAIAITSWGKTWLSVENASFNLLSLNSYIDVFLHQYLCGSNNISFADVG